MWKSKFYGAFVLNRRVVLHAIDATPARWRGDAGSSPLDRANDLVKNCRVHPTHWLISTQVHRLSPLQLARRHARKDCLGLFEDYVSQQNIDSHWHHGRLPEDRGALPTPRDARLGHRNAPAFFA